MNLKKYRDALAAFDQATSITVNNAEIWNNKGKAYFALGFSQDALQCYNKALGINPDFVDAKQNKEAAMNVAQIYNISGTITPTVTISRIGTLYPGTTLTTEPSATSVLTIQESITIQVQDTTVPVARNTTYSPLSPFVALYAVFIGAGLILFMKK
jgi:tetratricopeptide (TPR) repeat protein